MTLLADITRCLGEGSAGRVCPLRQTCRRYLDRNRDRQSGRPLSMTAMLCQTSQFEARIATQDTEARP